MANEDNVFNVETWEPKTKLGRLVKNKEINSIEEIFAKGETIKEPEIVDALLPNLENKLLEITSVQRMTKNGRRAKYKAIVIVGDRNGHIGLGLGKDQEVTAAVSEATRNAKKNIIPIYLGCGSWECNCGTQHSIPYTLIGKSGSVEIKLVPAPRGVGIVAGETAKIMLELAGIKDIWSFSKGHTRNTYNMAKATYLALRQLLMLRNIAH